MLRSSVNTGSPPIEAGSDADAWQRGIHAQQTEQYASSRPVLAARPASHESMSEPPGLTFDRLSHRRTASADAMTSNLRAQTDEDKRERSKTNIYEVRLSPSSGQILAASIPELIVRITSPNRLDYDLLSDFFLTYRLFISPSDLTLRLIQRMRVSVRSGDGWSRIVRVRTFVALRHWILNYFVDDFVSDYDLRVQFCDLVNKLCHGLREANPEKVGDLRTLDELKRCWRHTCALFWDVPMPPDGSYIDQDILPGGFVGSRLATPEIAQQQMEVTRGSIQHHNDHPDGESVASSRYMAHQANLDFAFNKTSELQASSSGNSSRAGPEWVDERQSMQVISCSIPAHATLARQPSQGPRPVPTPLQRTGRAKHTQFGCGAPRKHHNRSASFSDALRDDRVPLPAGRIWEDEDFAPMQQAVLPGSLIKGALLSPGAPYVEAVIPDSPRDDSPPGITQRYADGSSPDPVDKSSHFANPGVRKLIGSVRRALSVKNNTVPPSMGSFHDRKPSLSSEISGPFIAAPIGEPGVPKRKLVGGRTRLRVDLLAAEVSEAFKVAVREVAEAQRRAQASAESGQQGLQRARSSDDYLQRPLMPPKIGSNVTLGSRSIVIMDDTNGQVTPKPGAGFFGLERNDSAAISPGQTTNSQLQDVPLFLDESDRATNETPDVDTGAFDDRSSEIDALGIIAAGGQLVPTEELATSPPETLQLSEDGDSAEGPSIPLHRSYDRLLATGKNADGAVSYTEDSVTSTNDPFHLERAPAQGLRRMPGGNLKAANHVHSLDEHPQAVQGRILRDRSHSPAIPPRCSSANATHLLAEDKTITDGALTTAGMTVTSHSSQPMLRPSFEKEVAKLAQLPDEQDDGGIDDALRRLEGRGQQASPDDEPPQGVLLALAAQVHGLGAEPEEMIPRSAKHNRREDEVIEIPAEGGVEGPELMEDMSGSSRTPHIVVQSKHRSVAESEASYISIPLLERDASHPPRRRREPPSDLLMPVSPNLNQHQHGNTSPGGQRTLSEHNLSPSTTKSFSRSPKPHESFLLDDNETLSSVSGTIPADASADARSPGAESFLDDDDNASVTDDNQHLATDHLQQPIRELTRQRSASELNVPRPTNPLARTPSVDVQSRASTGLADRTPIKSRSADDLLDIKDQTPLTRSPAAAHLPYVLAYDSLLLAQQFTVIERDALCEVEWRDLIDLRWNQSVPPHSSWVDFLKVNENDPYGIPIRPGVDMCISRFNLVVRWAKSEIVLTQDVSERAATITKYIHIAKHARRLRNWATMYQLTMALVGADVSRLKTTWELVTQKDRATLKVLDTLITPTRNFHNLREEIESATATFARDGEGGCIPFIGIYTHDLIYNSQKALYVPGGDSTDSGIHRTAQKAEQVSPVLVNFERHHTAATIVKNLLRLIEASSRYNFGPVPEVASRCLWLGALGDAEITRRSKELEPGIERTSA